MRDGFVRTRPKHVTRKSIDKKIRRIREEVTRIDAELRDLALLSRRGIKLYGVTGKEFLTKRAVLKTRRGKAQDELIRLRKIKESLDQTGES